MTNPQTLAQDLKAFTLYGLRCLLDMALTEHVGGRILLLANYLQALDNDSTPPIIGMLAISLSLLQILQDYQEYQEKMPSREVLVDNLPYMHTRVADLVALLTKIFEGSRIS